MTDNPQHLPDGQPPEPDVPSAAQPADETEGRVVDVPGRGPINLRQGIPIESAGRARPESGWSGRRLARILAFQVLYELDLARHAPGPVMTRFLDAPEFTSDSDDYEYVHGPLPDDVARYARDLIGGVLRQREELDRELQERAPTWPLRQMSPVDRSILRLGLYECRYQHGIVPVKVAINEAIELAKLFGNEGLPRLVNGVLGSAVASESRPTP
jgi:transcription antitermination protein NusB